VLVEGKAIQIHPLVCPAYNADFDGDQMAVHVPLSAEAQAEARLLMLSVNNLLSPAHGKPIATPGQDLVLGCYYLTIARRGEKGEGKFFASPDEAYKAYKEGAVKLHSLIAVRMPKEKHVIGFTDEDKDKKLLVTTVGRLVFNRIFPDDFPYINDAVESTVDEFQYTGAVIDSVKERPIKEIIEELPLGRPVRKGFLVRLISMCHQKYGNTRTSVILDNLKTIGFRYATQSGTTVGVEDIVIPDEKDQIIKEAEKRVEEIEQQHRRGLITNDERYQLVIDSWTEAKERIQQAMLDGFDELNPVYMMAISGARGNVSQLSQLAGMRGLVADPSGRTIDFPIKANFREGLTVLEYFSSTHGTRKGLADTALRTADSGYLTRRLVDVAQDVIVREEDCGTDQGITLTAVWQGDDVLEPLRERIVGRVACEDIVHPDTGEVIIGVGCEILEDDARRIELAGITEVTVRSPLTCRTRYGVCVKCYGRNLATGNLVEVGEAVGIIAAQSIGEPGTQLTMRTFHTGGVAGDDITHGLPRVEELFEARKPKGQALISEIDGHVSIVESKGTRKVVVRAEDGEEKTYTVPYGARLEVREGQFITAGDQITEGSLNPHDILRVKGVRAVQSYLVREVQEVYRSQGVEINDKHIEVVIRQMLRKVKVEDPGDTDLLPGGLVDVFEFEEENARVMAEGKQPAIAKPVILGITKASLATDSFLSAASFQETTRVLTDASIKGRMDPLIGLKENVIIGKLIPAGTGMSRYRNVVPVSHVAEAAADSEDVLEYSDDSLGEDAAVSE